MSSRKLAALVLLAAAAIAERVGFYASRTRLLSAETHLSVGLVLGIREAAMVAGCFTSAGLLSMTNPIIAMLIGLLLASVGAYGHIPALTALGVGIFRVALYAAAADVVTEDRDHPTPRRFAAMMAFTFAVYAGLWSTSSLPSKPFNAGIIFVAAAAFVGIAGGLLRRAALVLAPTAPGSPYRAPAPPASTSAQPFKAQHAFTFLCVLAIGPAMASIGQASADRLQIESLGSHNLRSLVQWRGFVGLGVAATGSLVFTFAAIQRRTGSAIRVFGVALVTMGLGLLVQISGSGVALSVGGVLTSAGTVGTAIGLGYAALAFRDRRRTGLGIASWLSILTATSWVGWAAASEGLARPLLLLGGLGSLTVGITAIVQRDRIHRAWT